MPQIPVYTAQPRSAQPSSPSYISTDRGAGLAIVGRSLGELAQLHAEQVGRLRQLESDTEFLSLKTSYDAGIKDIHRVLSTDPDVIADPLSYPEVFTQRLQKLEGTLAKSTKNRDAIVRFNEYASNAAKMSMVDAREIGKRLSILKTHASFDALADKISLQAAQAGSMKEHNDLLRTYTDAVTQAEGVGAFNAVEAQKRRSDFEEKAQTAWMTVIGHTNVDMLVELNELDAFAKVNPAKRVALIDAALQRDAHIKAQAQVALGRVMKTWAESVQRKTESLAAERTLTRDWIDENRDALGDKHEHFLKVLDQQLSGESVGSPQLENIFQPLVYKNYTTAREAQQALDQLLLLRSQGFIRGDKAGPWATHLGGVVNRLTTESRTIQNEEQARERELANQRHAGAAAMTAGAFRTSGILSMNFDSAAEEAQTQFQTILETQSTARGGKRDPHEIVRNELPRFVARVQTRASALETFLTEQLAGFPNVPAIEAQRRALGEARYAELIRYAQELIKLRNEVKRLEGIRRNAVGDRGETR